jgi:hypothetical protein
LQRKIHLSDCLGVTAALLIDDSKEIQTVAVIRLRCEDFTVDFFRLSQSTGFMECHCSIKQRRPFGYCGHGFTPFAFALLRALGSDMARNEWAGMRDANGIRGRGAMGQLAKATPCASLQSSAEPVVGLVRVMREPGQILEYFIS